MIQDILPLHLNNRYEQKEPRKESRIMIFRENEILIRDSEILDFITFDEFEKMCDEAGRDLPEMVYLFTVGAEDYFLADLPDVGAVPADGFPAGYTFVRMFDVRPQKPKERVFAAATAWHLYTWYRDHRYCGRCAAKLTHDGKLRMLSCPVCGSQVFPKIAPAVIVGVTDGERILMTKYAGREYKRYALIAGFTEIGETAEETVAREVMEEVGLKVKNIRYYKSQPWGFDQNLLLGYFCELDDDGEIALDEEELATAEWVHYSSIPDDPEGLSLTRAMMTVFRDSFVKS